MKEQDKLETYLTKRLFIELFFRSKFLKLKYFKNNSLINY